MSNTNWAKVTWVDFLLAGVCGIMALYGVGMSITAERMGLVMVGIAALGTTISFFVSRALAGTKWMEASVWLYVVGMLSSPFLARALNPILPGGGFPPELLASAATISWMILIGSFLSWSDGRLTFQAVPCIAVFGLVGAFNTFAGATVTFFIFLLCAAALYSRTHQRSMLRRATLSGYRHLDAIRQGPWRWVAGPEWALISASAVIVLSLIGAPILQESVKGVSGVVRINPPRQSSQNNPNQPNTVTMATQSIGRGPLGELPQNPVLRAKIATPRHLRSETFSSYRTGQWEKTAFVEPMGGRGEPTFPMLSLDDIDQNFEVAEFKVQFLRIADPFLPVPTPVISLDDTSIRRGFDGSLPLGNVPPPNTIFSGTYGEVREKKVPQTTVRLQSDAYRVYSSLQDVPQRVREWAREKAGDGGTDYERALRVKRAIEEQVRYNLNAPAAPSGEDPVEWFLFGDVREGYCDLFASAMVLGARSIGIPARYTIGYFPTQLEQDEQGWYIVRQSDYHAWAELYFEGYGWIAMDATEGASAVAGGERGAGREDPAKERRKLLPWLINGAIAAAAIGGIILILRSRKVTSASPDRRRAELAQAYISFVVALEQATGHPRRFSESPDEYWKRVCDELPDHRDRAEAINKRFVDALYGPNEIDSLGLEGLETDVAALRNQLRAATRNGRRSA